MKIKDFGKLLLWDIINPIILKIKRRKRYDIPDTITGINIGCGFDNPPNWLGVDGGATLLLIRSLPNFIIKPFFKSFNMGAIYSFDEYSKRVKNIRIIHHDLLFGLPFKNESVPNIFSSHFFEHLFKKDAIKLLKESFRVLKPNGYIRICVPSIDTEVAAIKTAIDEYDNGNILPIQKYVTSEIVGHIASFSNHRWMYNFQELKKLLVIAGFFEIKQTMYGKGQIPNIESLDTRDGLFIEARK